MPATRNSYTFKEGLTMMAAKAVGIDPYLAAEAGENARAAINAIRNAAKAKHPKDRAGYIREAQSEMRGISAAKHPKLVNALQARMLALQGRGGDTELAHLTPGEVVLPRSLQTPELMKYIASLAARQGINPARLAVGHRANSINPTTGQREFIEEILVTTGSDRVPSIGPINLGTIESGIRNTIRDLLAEGWELLPDGSWKAPNGQIVPRATQTIEVTTKNTKHKPQPRLYLDDPRDVYGPFSMAYPEAAGFTNPIDPDLFREKYESMTPDELRKEKAELADLLNDLGLEAVVTGAIASRFAAGLRIGVLAGMTPATVIALGYGALQYNIRGRLNIIDSLLSK